MEPVLDGSPHDRHLVAILLLLRQAGVPTSEAVLTEDDEGQLHGHTVGLVREGENLELVLVRHGDGRRWSLLYNHREELQHRLQTWVEALRQAQLGRRQPGPTLLPPTTALDQLREQCQRWRAQDTQRAWRIAACDWTQPEALPTYQCQYQGCQRSFTRARERRGPEPLYCSAACQQAALIERLHPRLHPCERPGCTGLARYHYCSRQCVAQAFAERRRLAQMPARQVAHG